ncbi:Nucleoside-diphosphate-sugar epimerase [Pedobacter steynii]|uniref:Nucleoside-diphosphate-sugar epimerase n=2 Tax=Pedobacter steynii TaxID=430522 RepID=A0A1H0FDP6_9SPHI|nr:NAD-dependent epimerase/dehydratase family protein [Pedobacter steynii]NQX42132.1 NAD-dependent epimerase/dehydratase family protein [Pedobacter steynii]SDN92837.1 Nucleoside-diphosphate-sugar epimerase [Pedobacter steynii]
MILVTGATGFLGAELIHQLTGGGAKLRALKREHSVIPDLIKDNPLIEWAIADINDLSTLDTAFEDIHQVYHCAAMISFDPRDKAKLLKVNIEGTSNVVNLCVENQARLLHVSSVAALGNAKKGQLITEKDFWEYDSKAHSYAISKYEGEMEVWRGIAEGLEAVIVNPSVIIGGTAGFQGSGAIFKLVKEGLSFYTKGATGIVDVRDVAKSMIALMNSTITEQRFTISAENYNYQRFFGEIAKGFGVKAPAKEAKPWMLGIAWRAAKFAALFTGKPAALTSDAARSSLNESLYSNKKIIETIGITFKPLDQTIAETCQALKQLPLP